ITMPGEITSHTVNGQTVGAVDSSGSEFTLAIDDAYLRTFGAGSKWIHIESQVSQCDAQCSAQPNMVWDRSAPGPGCTCVCEAGYESDDRGDCVACDQVCAAYDPRAVYDPADSRPNQCGCKCTGNFMEFAWGESSGACRCIAGAERKGDDCVCKSGHEVSTDGTRCIEQTGEEEKENCPSGTNCLKNPDECTCGRGTLCDPLGEFKDDETFCSVPIAYIFIAEDVTPWEYVWITQKITAIRTFFQDRGYTTVTRWQGVGLKMESYLGRASTDAVAYFGHGLEPSVDGMNASQLSGAVFEATRDQYGELGYSAQETYQMSQAKRDNLGIKYFYNHSCHSLDDKTVRDYVVGSGSSYWGYIGTLRPFNNLTETRKP
ncbi:MAG: hypothetical protein MUQ10_12730, partial [Anaerolineae bacterium]|nr:hypothetical protein [Anaerolineae bacterium]